MADCADLAYGPDGVLVRSIESTTPVCLRFNNKTNRPINVWWRNFQGLKTHYRRLEPGASYDQDSFVTHPWECTDVDSRVKYLINNRPIYTPQNDIAGRAERTNLDVTVGSESHSSCCNCHSCSAHY